PEGTEGSPSTSTGSAAARSARALSPLGSVGLFRVWAGVGVAITHAASLTAGTVWSDPRPGWDHGAVPETPDRTDATRPPAADDPLLRAAVDTEQHVARAGWDQPPRLFALVRTSRLREREPDLVPDLGPGDGYTAIEQEGLPPT